MRGLDLKATCPKDPFLPPRINQIVDSTAGGNLLCFLHAFLGYHQTKMAKEDAEKKIFISTNDCFCYICLSFGL
jgi:hypothetical protein